MGQFKVGRPVNVFDSVFVNSEHKVVFGVITSILVPLDPLLETHHSNERYEDAMYIYQTSYEYEWMT